MGSGYDRKINQLKKKKADLTDDRTAIRDINSAIRNISSEMESYIGTKAAQPVADLLEGYLEPYQDSDSLLISAGDCIQREIAALEQAKAAEEAAIREKLQEAVDGIVQAAKDPFGLGRGSDGAGGGSW